MPRLSFLIILCENLGDGICCTPAIRLLRDKFPTAKIDALAINKVAAEVLEGNPDVNQIVLLASLSDLVGFSAPYDHCLLLIPTPEALKLAKRLDRPFLQARLPKPEHLREVGLALIQTHFPHPAVMSASHYFLYPQSRHYAAIEHKLKLAGVDLAGKDKWIICHMGCHKVAKRANRFWKRGLSSHRTWPFRRFNRLMKEIRQAYPQVRWIMTGTAAEKILLKRYIEVWDSVIDLMGETSVLELAALMDYGRVFLSGDTGPMHVAACRTIPMVSLFGSTAVSVSGPWPLLENRLCLEGGAIKVGGDIRAISVKQVKQALEKWL